MKKAIFSKRLTAFFAVVLSLILCSSAAYAVSDGAEKEFSEIKNGLIDCFNGTGADLNKDITFKLKPEGLGLKESAMLRSVSFVIKSGTVGDRSVFNLKVKLLGIGAASVTVDRSARGLGICIPKLDDTYYLIDSALLDELLRTAAEELNCASWAEASDWIKSVTLSEIMDELGDLSGIILDNVDVKISSSSPSTVEVPSAPEEVISTEDELFEVLNRLGENLSDRM